MTAGSENARLRLFVGLDLPEDVRAALTAWRSRILGETPVLRPVAADALHVTLCFLGSQPAEGLSAIATAFEVALGGAAAPQLRVAAGLWLPPRRPRVLAVTLDDPSGALGRIQAAVSGALADGGWYTPEKRPFLAHVTVARVPARARVRATEPSAPESMRFRAPSVTRYRARLQRAGARYESLRRVALTHRGAA